MSYGYWGTRRDDSCDSLKRENERLRSELDDQQEQARRRSAEAQHEREQQRKERQQEAREAMHHASTWEEAFRKGIYLYEHEAHEEQRDVETYPELAEGGYLGFQKTVPELHKAKAIYEEVMQEVEEQIAALRQGGLERVAMRVGEECDCTTMIGGLVDALRENNPEWLTDW